jgi:hypothetical protein
LEDRGHEGLGQLRIGAGSDLQRPAKWGLATDWSSSMGCCGLELEEGMDMVGSCGRAAPAWGSGKVGGSGGPSSHQAWSHECSRRTILGQ